MCPITKDLSFLTQRLNDIVKNEMCMLSFHILSICTIMEKLYILCMRWIKYKSGPDLEF